MNPFRITTASLHPPLSKKDATYVEATYLSVEELCFGRDISATTVFKAMLSRRMPLPSYLLGDQLMVPVDYLALHDDAGSLGKVREVFERRLLSAKRQTGFDDGRALEDSWNDYLSGEFGICLWSVTPESIAAKGVAMANIASLVAEPSPDDSDWAEKLRIWVKRLDLIERPFADADEVRFGARTSRARYIEDVKKTYPDTFALTEERFCIAN